MQLLMQIPAGRLNRCAPIAPEESDVLFHFDPSTTVDTLTIRLTSYEVNACMCRSYFRTLSVFILHLSILGNLFELLRRCSNLHKREIIMPILPATWLELATITRNSFRKCFSYYSA